MSAVFVYTLSNPETGEVRYVGVTRDPKDRARSHCSIKDKSHRSCWVKSLREKGLRPKLAVIEETDEDNWQAREQFWIAAYRRLIGDRLTNGDDGGLNRLRHSDELRGKISATLKGRANPDRWKRVYAYSMKGFLLAEFASLQIALKVINRPSGTQGNLCRAIKEKGSYYGFLWSYDKVDRFVSPKYDAQGKPIVTNEYREHMRQKSTGRGIGRIVSAETRARQSVSAIRRWKGD